MSPYYTQRKSAAIKLVTGGPVACQSCGFSIIRALQFDHIVEVGEREKRHLGNGALRGGTQMVTAILTGRQDITEIQVLCANCHCLKGE